MGSSPITRSSFATRAGLVQRKNACLTSKLRGFDSCTRHQFHCPGIAQLAEHAIDNREIVGSSPTPWTICSSGRRQAERHQASILALRGFESHRPLHCRKQKALVRCCPKSALAAQCTFHLRNSDDRESRCLRATSYSGLSQFRTALTTVARCGHYLHRKQCLRFLSGHSGQQGNHKKIPNPQNQENLSHCLAQRANLPNVSYIY